MCDCPTPIPTRQIEAALRGGATLQAFRHALPFVLLQVCPPRRG